MNAPISVVIPCFRCTETIDRAVESIFQQTLQPYEVILVEDCSGDETLNKLYQLQEKYPEGWIKVIALKQNSGPGTARNQGWDSSTQEYVAFLDADDSWHHQKTELQYKWMKENPQATLTGTAILQIPKKQPEQIKINQIEFRQVKKSKLLFSNKFTTSSVILKRSIPQRFLDKKKYSEDYLLWSEICYSGSNGFVSKEKLTYQYKAGFGAGGLTGNMWRLEKGELDTYIRLHRKSLISTSELILATPYSVIKYFLREILAKRSKPQPIRQPKKITKPQPTNSVNQ